MMILLYRLLFIPGLILGLPYYAFRMWRRGGYREGFKNRFGLMGKVPPKIQNVKRIWIQAVSVGELLAIGPLLKRLQEDPQVEVVLTTTTSTGLRVLRERLAQFTVWNGIFPLDFWPCSRGAWKAIRPDLIVLMEGELWPEHIHQAKTRKIPAVLVNARISDRSFSRHQSLKSLASAYFGSLESILAGSVTDQERFRDLGWLPKERIHLTGNLKMDVDQEPLPEAKARTSLLDEFGFPADTTILLGSSTWPGEEEALLKAYQELQPQFNPLRLLIVPRHAERRKELEELMQQFPGTSHFRSSGKQAPSGTEVYIADTTGELRMLTQFSDLVFIGKSLPPNAGGQTPVEAAAMGKPLVFGSDMSNFRDISRSLLRTGAAVMIASPEQLTETIRRLLLSSEERTKMGEAAYDCIRSSSGATNRVIQHIKNCLS